MSRPRTLSTFLILGLLAPAVYAQTPEQLDQTAHHFASLQNPDGGFALAEGQPSSLGSTSSAIRILKYVGGSIPNPSSCRAYVKSCFDPQTGAFNTQPGSGETSAATTAVGLMAVSELRIAEPEMTAKAVAYLGEHAKSFDEVRIAVAGLEAVNAKPPKPEAWYEIVTAGRNDDGTWGSGDNRAFDTGGRAVALLRMGRELKHRDAILQALRDGQHSGGGWGDGGPSNLPATYRVMRAFFMMDEQPNLDALRSFIARCRNDDGTYSTTPDQKNKNGTYYATIVLWWSRQLEGEPAVLETAGFKPMLHGDSLDGWDGDTMLWKIQDGKLVGTSPGIKNNEFLVAPGTYKDFILKFSFRLKDGKGNSGVQFRSVRVPGSTEMNGYQADIGENYWGCLYDESRRNRVLAQTSERASKTVNEDGWNHYVIRVMGDHILLMLNGVLSVDYREEDSRIADSGRIGFQIHAGGPMQIEFKDIYLQELPSPTADNADNPGFHLRTVKVGDEQRKYTVFLPEGYDGSKSYPVVLFLHGSGERGDDGITSAQVGLGAIIAGHPKDFPVIAVFPQARRTWAANSDDARGALAALDDVMKTYKTAPDRVILTGLSMGGFGTWQLASTEHGRWAAIAPVCGFSETAAVKPIVEARLPVWTFIGDADSARLLESTRAMLAALRDAGAKPRETEYRGVGHNSWDRAYSNPEFLRWMLQQHRGD